MMYNDKELANFFSAPLNADSALNGNSDLDKRHKLLLDELKNLRPLKSNQNKHVDIN